MQTNCDPSGTPTFLRSSATPVGAFKARKREMRFLCCAMQSSYRSISKRLCAVLRRLLSRCPRTSNVPRKGWRVVQKKHRRNLPRYSRSRWRRWPHVSSFVFSRIIYGLSWRAGVSSHLNGHRKQCCWTMAQTQPGPCSYTRTETLEVSETVSGRSWSRLLNSSRKRSAFLPLLSRCGTSRTSTVPRKHFTHFSTSSPDVDAVNISIGRSNFPLNVDGMLKSKGIRLPEQPR